MMLLCMVSCKKEDGETPNPAEKDFFIDVDFLPKTETNGALAPRLMVNFNDEAVMIELRSPSASTPLESVLFLYPDNKAMMMCGNDNLMVCAEYDMETLAPSDDVLLVTQMDDNALLLTKCVMDWNTNTITKGDQMILPIDGTGKKRTGKGGDDDDMRWFFFNHFIKPLTEKLDQFESFCDIFPVPQGIVVTYIKTIISTAVPIILFSDDPESFIDAMEYPITSYTETAVQTGVLHFAPQDVSDMSSRILAGIGWYTSGGHGTVDENEGNGEASKLPFSTFYSQSSNATYAASQISALDPVYIVNLNVSNITENSAYLRGSFQFGNTSSSITPIEMGYIYKVSGGDEHTVEDMHFYGKTISGLHKATKYTAYAYARSIMGDMVLSPAVTFKTLGFEAFPSSLSFPAEGDTKFVALSYSEEDITSWEITSKPSWCTTIIDDFGLLAVTVGASTETRSGTITITAHSNTLGSVTESVEIIQKINEIDGDWVDLGLPSGILWATRNVGASSPTDYGSYFAWGEIQHVNHNEYMHCHHGDLEQLTKYCTNPDYGFNGFTDNLTILQPMDDAATANYGGRIPTEEEWNELLDRTTSCWVTINGVNGRRFTGPNGNSIFLPAGGYRWDEGNHGGYWSSSLFTFRPKFAFHFYFDSEYYFMDYITRDYGQLVRAVCKK